MKGKSFLLENLIGDQGSASTVTGPITTGPIDEESRKVITGPVTTGPVNEESALVKDQSFHDDHTGYKEQSKNKLVLNLYGPVSIEAEKQSVSLEELVEKLLTDGEGNAKYIIELVQAAVVAGPKALKKAAYRIAQGSPEEVYELIVRRFAPKWCDHLNEEYAPYVRHEMENVIVRFGVDFVSYLLHLVAQFFDNGFTADAANYVKYKLDQLVGGVSDPIECALIEGLYIFFDGIGRGISCDAFYSAPPMRFCRRIPR